MKHYIAIDFDDTIMDYKTERPVKGVKLVLDSYREQGHYITVFTSRADSKYGFVKDWLEAHKIPFDRIICGKPFYTLMICDRAKRFEGWGIDYLL